MQFSVCMTLNTKPAYGRFLLIFPTVVQNHHVQWRHYTRARQVKWPGGKIHRPGSALHSPVYCFASVIVWTENKNVTVSDRFICFILMVKRRWWPVFWGQQLKIKVVNFFLRKSACASRWPGWRIFWPLNDLAPLLRWCRHWLRRWDGQINIKCCIFSQYDLMRQ